MSLKAWGAAAGLVVASLVAGVGAGDTIGAAQAAQATAPPPVVAPATFAGKVVVSDVLIAPASEFPSEGSRIAALRRFERTAVDGTGGFWRFHFVAFLTEPAPATGTLKVVATDVTEARHRDRVKVFEVGAPAGTTELRVRFLGWGPRGGPPEWRVSAFGWGGPWAFQPAHR